MEVSTKKEVKESKKPNYKYLRDKDREMVKGIFRFHECPGGVMSFVVKIWKEDPVEKYDLVDGQIYTIPLGVAKHLNKNCAYPEYSYIKSGDNKTFGGYSHDGQVMKVSKMIRRCSFQSLEFIDPQDIGEANNSSVLQVENTLL